MTTDKYWRRHQPLPHVYYALYVKNESVVRLNRLWRFRKINTCVFMYVMHWQKQIPQPPLSHASLPHDRVVICLATAHRDYIRTYYRVYSTLYISADNVLYACRTLQRLLNSVVVLIGGPLSYMQKKHIRRCLYAQQQPHILISHIPLPHSIK